MNAERRELTPEIVRRLTIDPEPWLSCDDCFRFLDEFVDLVLANQDFELLPPMRVHLAGCSACREEAVSVLQLAAAEAGIDPADAERGLRSE